MFGVKLSDVYTLKLTLLLVVSLTGLLKLASQLSLVTA